MAKQTCGPLYKKQLDYFTGGNPDLVKAFAAGFISGQAEKIYLGACMAAMFRPSAEYADMVENPRAWQAMEMLDAVSAGSSQEWHFVRGILTGVSILDIDYEFHKRKGFGEVCDR